MKSVKTNVQDAPLFREVLIGLDLSDSCIETAVKTWGNVDDNPVVSNYVVKAVIGGMDKSEDYKEEEKSESHKV